MLPLPPMTAFWLGNLSALLSLAGVILAYRGYRRRRVSWPAVGFGVAGGALSVAVLTSVLIT